MNKPALITARRLREVTLYDPETGIFTWRIPRKKASVGARVGCPDPRGYLVTRIDYQRYYLHRLAWLYMTGEWPVDEIDHRDQNRSNNRWRNLRQASTKQNIENGPRRKNNTSGEIGVMWSKIHKRWIARIVHNREKINLGYFLSFDAAVAARRAAVLRLFTHAPVCDTPDAYRDSGAERGIADREP